jgi:alpha-ketoglutarate-dependent taurine dioxygenase
MTTTKRDLDVRRVGGWIGAEISEVGLSGDMDDSIILAIREALLAHKVLFFRDQHHLDPAGPTAVARRFGQLTAAPPAIAAIAGTRYILEFDNTGGHVPVIRLENRVRWRSAPGDVAMGDNRATQHYAIADYGTMGRRVQRITRAVDIPVGVDVRASVICRGDMGRSLAHPPTSGEA